MSIYQTTKKVIVDEWSKIHKASANWLPCSAVTGLLTREFALEINFFGTNLIGSSPFVTGILSLAASQIGWHLLPASQENSVQRTLLRLVHCST